MRRQVAAGLLGLFLTVSACGHARRTGGSTANEGGCKHDCGAGGTSSASGSSAEGGAPPGGFVFGGSSVGGSPAFGGSVSGSAGTASAPVVPIDCQPSALLCFGGDVYICDAAGASAKLAQDCGLFAHCHELYPGDCMCIPDKCTPGTAVCDGNLVKTCNQDGTLPSSGSSCGDLVCIKSTCQPKICDPHNPYLCVGNDVYRCIEPGATTALVQPCITGSSCQGESPNVECTPLTCQPDSTACVGNQVGLCDASGTALTRLDQNCAATGKVCTNAGACSQSAVDDLGGTTRSTESTGASNIIDVRSNRRLTQLQINLRPLAGDVSVQWAVSRILPSGGDELIATTDTVAHAGDTTASTSALDCMLEAGERYQLATYFDVPANVDYDLVNALSFASFGTVSWAADLSRIVYAMRVTTTLP